MQFYRNSLTKRSIIEYYESLVLIIDEIIDEG